MVGREHECAEQAAVGQASAADQLSENTFTVIMGSGASTSVQQTKKVYLDISGKEVSVGWKSGIGNHLGVPAFSLRIIYMSFLKHCSTPYMVGLSLPQVEFSPQCSSREVKELLTSAAGLSRSASLTIG